jgi:hypothetical protein
MTLAGGNLGCNALAANVGDGREDLHEALLKIPAIKVEMWHSNQGGDVAFELSFEACDRRLYGSSILQRIK